MAYLALLHLYRKWLTVNLLAEAEKSFTTPSLRYLIFQSESRLASSGEKIPGNGLAPAIRRIGRKVIINHGLFLDWIAGEEISQVDLGALMREGEDISDADPSDNPQPKREPARLRRRTDGGFETPRPARPGGVSRASRTTGQLNG